MSLEKELEELKLRHKIVCRLVIEQMMSVAKVTSAVDGQSVLDGFIDKEIQAQKSANFKFNVGDIVSAVKNSTYKLKIEELGDDKYFVILIYRDMFQRWHTSGKSIALKREELESEYKLFQNKNGVLNGEDD